MPTILTPFKELSEQEQAVFYHARRRRESVMDPSRGLFRTHRFDIPTANIPVAAFPTAKLGQQVTVRTKIRITGSALGAIFEFGDSTAGIALALDGQSLYFTAGDGTASSSDSATIQFDNGAAWPAGLELDIVAACRPSEGTIRLWLDGDLSGFAQASGGALLNSRWSGAAAGSFASAPNGTINLNIPSSARIAPSGFKVIAPLSVFVGQVPQQYLAAAEAPGGGDPYADLKASPHDFGTILGSLDGMALELPGDAELFVETDVPVVNDIQIDFTNPVDQVLIGNFSAGVPKSIGTFSELQTINFNNSIGVTANFELQLAGQEVIGTGTFQGL